MIDYDKSRKIMADCQIGPGGVTNPEILAAFEKVPREEFLPDELKSVAYVDEDLFLPGGGFLMEPLVCARMLHAAAPRMSDIALNIGDTTGYVLAVLTELVTAVFSGDAGGAPKNAPYNLIIINGAVETVPDVLKKQLAVGGRLVTIIRERGKSFGGLTLIRRDGEDAFSRLNLFDAATPYLAGFAPQEVFVF